LRERSLTAYRGFLENARGARRNRSAAFRSPKGAGDGRASKRIIPASPLGDVGRNCQTPKSPSLATVDAHNTCHRGPHHRPHTHAVRSNPHSAVARLPHHRGVPTRGFLPWRFLDAGPRARGTIREGPASETVHNNGRLGEPTDSAACRVSGERTLAPLGSRGRPAAL